MPASTPRLPIDYHVICDDTHAYLFFTGDNGRFYRCRTKIEDFPKGMSDPEIAIQDNRNNLFEGSMTLQDQGHRYLSHHDRSHRARHDTTAPGSPTISTASGRRSPAPIHGRRRSRESTTSPSRTASSLGREDISHGELLRDNYDQTPTIDPENLRFLFQGRDPDSGGPYHLVALSAWTLDVGPIRRISATRRGSALPACMTDGKVSRKHLTRGSRMPNRIISTALIGCAAWAAAAYGQINDVTTTEAKPTASVGLKDAFDGKFLIGAAGDLRGYSDAELANIKAN